MFNNKVIDTAGAISDKIFMKYNFYHNATHIQYILYLNPFISLYIYFYVIKNTINFLIDLFCEKLPYHVS